MKNLETMPNPAQEPKKPLVQEEGDVEHLMKAFEQVDKEKAAQAAVRVSKDSNPEFTKIQAENDAELKAEADAYRAKELEWLYETYRFNEFGVDALQRGGISPERKAMKEAYTEMFDAFGDQIHDAMELVVREPEIATRAIVTPVEERLKRQADPKWNETFNNLSDARVKQLYSNKMREIRAEAGEFLTTLLKHELDTEDDPEKISALHKLLEGVEAYKERHE